MVMRRTLLSLLPLLATSAFVAGCGGDGPTRGEKVVAALEKDLSGGHHGALRRDLRAMETGDLDTPDLRLRAARVAMEGGDPALAADLLEDDARRDASVRLLRVEALIRCGRFADADTSLRKLEASGQGGERRDVLHGMLAMGRRDLRRVEDRIRPLVDGGTADPDAWVFWAQLASGNRTEVERRLLAGMQRVAESDRWVLRKALGRHLLSVEQPVRAVPHLRDVVTERPWDRDARISLVAALRRSGAPDLLEEAMRRARENVADDPDEPSAALMLAEVLGEYGRVDPTGRFRELEEALGLYEGLLAGPDPQGEDPVRRRILLLQGLARVHVELIIKDSSELEGSHFEAALAALRQAESLDPQGQQMSMWGPLTAETLYLMGRAYKRAHRGDDDATLALGFYDRALAMNPGHLDATWELGVLIYDFFRLKPGFAERAEELMQVHERIRRDRGLPPLAGKLMDIRKHIHDLVSKGLQFEPGTSTPETNGDGGKGDD